ncbi:hypothetical protein [Solibacillus sp. FSL H8-0538]|uniref:hypothetical protein n=1 Tax=Solibacillus sp. FSL H8-0538 TaxID=2921400 RepID=UPI0030FA6F3F
MKGRGLKKPRIDKKRDVQPTISISLKDVIYRISYIIDRPVKTICEETCIHGLMSKKVLDELSQHFKRSVQFQNTMYIGRLDNPSVQRMSIMTAKERIGIRFKAFDYENISTLAFALGVTPSRATALLLEASIKDNDFINAYLEKHLAYTLDDNRMKELRKVIRYLNINNPYDEKISWLALLTYIFNEVKDSAVSVHDTLVDYLNKWRD